MNVSHIRKRLKGGFRPFVICTSDGNEYLVPHPEFILVTDRTVVVAESDGLVQVIDPLHITAVNDVRAPSRSK